MEVKIHFQHVLKYKPDASVSLVGWDGSEREIR